MDWMIELAAAGGTTLVSAAATDAWQAARTGFVRLFERGDGNRRRLAESRLDATAAAIGQTGDAEGDIVRKAQSAAWQTRLADLLEEDPAAAAELRALIEHLVSVLSVEQKLVTVASQTGAAVATDRSVANSGVISGNVSAGGQ
ncbi:hypothetical protein AB0I95_21860 [Micromonospora sp. NPDC049751]|uniref:hypothetical protein n=1 Tax=Micromonospora sp. NPDC049751 TaxID=3154837 RepID=UPI003409A3D1